MSGKLHEAAARLRAEPPLSPSCKALKPNAHIPLMTSMPLIALELSNTIRTYAYVCIHQQKDVPCSIKIPLAKAQALVQGMDHNLKSFSCRWSTIKGKSCSTLGQNSRSATADAVRQHTQTASIETHCSTKTLQSSRLVQGGVAPEGAWMIGTT